MKLLIVKYSFALSIAWAFIILGLCSFPGQYIPSVDFLELLSFDKFVHAGIFFVLLLLLLVFLKNQHKLSLVIPVFICCILYGMALELMQATVFSHRSADWLDVIANSTGALLAFLLKNKIYAYFKL